MTIDFVEVDKFNVVVLRGNDHIATIRAHGSKIDLSDDGTDVTIKDFELVLEKMKELNSLRSNKHD